MIHDLIMPKMGESITEATLLKWLFKVGDEVTQDQPVLEIATDKVDSEILSPVSGKIVQIFFKENDVVLIGAILAKISDGDYENEAEVLDSEFNEHMDIPVDLPTLEVPFQPKIISSTQEIHPTVSFDSKDRFYSPLVKTIAQEENLSFQELDKIKGTGADGRVTKQDVLSYLDREKSLRSTNIPIAASNSVRTQQIEGQDEIIEMDRMKKLIADHMLHSKNVAAHVTSFVEVDVTPIVQWRNSHKVDFQKKYNQNITFTPIFIDALIKALKLFPLLNATINGYQITKKKDIHIGMATSLTNGNLIVPVIRHADLLNIQGLVHTVNDLATRARENQLKPEEIAGGTFTITNIGSFGSLLGTPIINQPQVAILAVGAIKKKPVVLETVHGDVIAIRHCMYMSLTYDHRVINGYLGGTFLKKIADLLESFDPSTPI